MVRELYQDSFPHLLTSTKVIVSISEHGGIGSRAESESATTSMSTFSLDEEVRLYTNNADRERYNLLATLFGIIVALDYLERAYVRDSITAAE